MPNFNEPPQLDRHLASNIAMNFLNGEITYHEFMNKYPDETDDNEIEELFSFVEHLPQQGGIFGVTLRRYDSYIAEIRILIEQLRKYHK